MRTALGSYARNFIIQETFTMNYGYHDIESVSLGMFLSGFAGHDGIRSDSSAGTPPMAVPILWQQVPRI